MLGLVVPSLSSQTFVSNGDPRADIEVTVVVMLLKPLNVQIV